jgi:hypothetical protein
MLVLNYIYMKNLRRFLSTPEMLKNNLILTHFSVVFNDKMTVW